MAGSIGFGWELGSMDSERSGVGGNLDILWVGLLAQTSRLVRVATATVRFMYQASSKIGTYRCKPIPGLVLNGCGGLFLSNRVIVY